MYIPGISDLPDIKPKAQKVGDTIADMRIVASKSNDPIHFGFHKGEGVYDITAHEAIQKHGSMGMAAQELVKQGYVVAVRYKGQRNIQSDHLHFVDPNLNPTEAARIKQQKGVLWQKSSADKQARMAELKKAQNEPVGTRIGAYTLGVPQNIPAPGVRPVSEQPRTLPPSMVGGRGVLYGTPIQLDEFKEPPAVTYGKNVVTSVGQTAVDFVKGGAAFGFQAAATGLKAALNVAGVKDEKGKKVGFGDILWSMRDEDVQKDWEIINSMPEGTRKKITTELQLFVDSLTEPLTIEQGKQMLHAIGEGVYTAPEQFKTGNIKPLLSSVGIALAVGAGAAHGAGKLGILKKPTIIPAEIARPELTQARGIVAGRGRLGVMAEKPSNLTSSSKTPKEIIPIEAQRPVEPVIKQSLQVEPSGKTGQLKPSSKTAKKTSPIEAEGQVGKDATSLLNQAQNQISNLDADTTIKIATTIAKMNGHSEIGIADMAEALGYASRTGKGFDILNESWKLTKGKYGLEHEAAIKARTNELIKQGMNGREASDIAEKELGAYWQGRASEVRQQTIKDYPDLQAKYATPTVKENLTPDQISQVGKKVNPTELEAIKLGSKPALLLKRFKRYIGVMKPEYAKIFKDGILDFENKRFVSKDGNYELVWNVRERPSSPISYNNQQTSEGSVFLRRTQPLQPNKAVSPVSEKPAKTESVTKGHELGEIKSAEVKLSANEAKRQEIRAKRAERLAKEEASLPEAAKSKKSQAGYSRKFTKEDFQDAIEIGKTYIDDGIIKIEEFGKKMVDEFGEAIKPYIKKVYDTANQQSNIVSIKNKTMSEKAAEMGLPGIPKPKKITAQERMQVAAKKKMFGRVTGTKLVDELEGSMRPLDQYENSILLDHVKTLEAKLTEARNKHGNDSPQVKEAETQWDRARRIAKATGTEQARALQSRATIEAPETIEQWLQQGRENRGDKFTPDARNKVITIHEKLQKGLAVEAKLDARNRVPEVTEHAVRSSGWGKSNTLFKFEKLQAMRAENMRLMSRPMAGLDPTLLKNLGFEIGYHAEAAAREGYRLTYNMARTLMRRTYGKRLNEKAMKEAWDAADVEGINEQIKPEDVMKARQAKYLKGQKTRGENIQAQVDAGITKPNKMPIKWTNKMVKVHNENVKLRYKLEAITNPDKSLGAKVADVVMFIPNAFTGAFAGWDDSILGRQGWNVLFTDKKVWVKAANKSLKALFSEAEARTFDSAITEHPEFAYVHKTMKVRYEPWEEFSMTGATEESIRYMKTLEDVPVIGKAMRPFVRAFTTGANYMRHQLAYDLIDIRKGLGKELTDTMAREYGRDINIISKYGELGAVENVAPAFRAIFISVRKLAADVQGISDIFGLGITTKGKSRPLEIRVKRLKMYAKMAGVITGLGLMVNNSKAGKEGKIEVKLDNPDDPDWLQLRIGNTRYPLTAGEAQVLRMIWRMGEGVYDYSRWGDAKYGTPKAHDAVINFLDRRIAPGLNYVARMIQGKDFVGREQSTKEITKDFFKPWIYNDIQEAWREEGKTMAIFAAIASFFGKSPTSYTKEAKTKKKSTDLYGSELYAPSKGDKLYGDKLYE
jgi:hypothetical protein